MASADGAGHGTAGAASPWFARIAADLLESGNMKEALRVCVEGTRVFPRYTTGRLLLGRCYEALGSHVEAMLEYAHVLEVFPDNALMRELLRRAEQREQQGFEAFAGEWQARWQGRKDRLTFEEYVGSPGTAAGEQEVSPDALQVAPDAPQVAPGAPQVAGELPGVEPDVTPQVSLDASQAVPLSEPAPEPAPDPALQAPQVAPGAPQVVPDVPREAPGEPPPGRFVTATLAEIYASQGEFNEAIDAYRTLAAQRPGSAERYQRRLAELEELKKKSEQGTPRGAT